MVKNGLEQRFSNGVLTSLRCEKSSGVPRNVSVEFNQDSKNQQMYFKMQHFKYCCLLSSEVQNHKVAFLPNLFQCFKKSFTKKRHRTAMERDRKPYYNILLFTRFNIYNYQKNTIHYQCYIYVKYAFLKQIMLTTINFG